MRFLIVLGVLASGVAVAAPAKQAKSTVVFEARWTSGKTRVVTKLFSTGMWTRLATTPGQPSSTETGRIGTQRFDEIKTTLKAAKWKRSKPQAQCLGVDTDTIDFYVGSSKRHTAVTCGGWEIDEASAKAIEMIGSAIPDGFANPPLTYEEVMAVP